MNGSGLSREERPEIALAASWPYCAFSVLLRDPETKEITVLRAINLGFPRVGVKRELKFAPFVRLSN